MQLISIHCCIHLQMQRPEVGINFIPLYRKAYRHPHSISNYTTVRITQYSSMPCATYKTKQKQFDEPRTCDSLKSTASPLSLRGDDACDPAAPLAPPPMPRRFFDTPSTCEHGAPQPDNSRISVSAAPSTEAHPMPARGRQAKLAPTRNAPHRSAGARVALAAAGAARGRRRRGGSRRTWPWMRRWRGRGGAPGKRGARRRTPFGRFLSPQE